MTVADAKFGGDAFPTPSESALKQTLPTVPDVSGRSYEEASQLLTAAGFTVVDGGEEDSVIAAGMVSSTNPAGGSSVPAGIGITVYRSNASMTKLPDVVGQGYDQARTALNSAGFASVVGQCQSGPSATPANPDPVLSSSPAAGTDAKRSSQVTLVVDC
jgi:beta-lactam-binding protein with PASTA domain